MDFPGQSWKWRQRNIHLRLTELPSLFNHNQMKSGAVWSLFQTRQLSRGGCKLANLKLIRFGWIVRLMGDWLNSALNRITVPVEAEEPGATPVSPGEIGFRTGRSKETGEKSVELQLKKMMKMSTTTTYLSLEKKKQKKKKKKGRGAAFNLRVGWSWHFDGGRCSSELIPRHAMIYLLYFCFWRSRGGGRGGQLKTVRIRKLFVCWFGNVMDGSNWTAPDRRLLFCLNIVRIGVTGRIGWLSAVRSSRNERRWPGRATLIGWNWWR